MKKRSRLSGIIALLLTVTFMTAVNASVFPDILQKHSWAEEAIDDMVSRSILKGFPDGTFRPDNGITKLDALIIASRIAGVDLPENTDYAAAALKAHEKDLEIYDINYKNEVAYLLYKGILTTDELPSYIGDGVKANALKRHEAAILLTKLMGGTKKAQAVAGYSVNYADLNDIPQASLPYVNYVNETGVMKGMENNMFMPYYEVSRAMMATMMYRAEKFLDYDVFEMKVTTVSVQENKVSGTVGDTEASFVLSADSRLLIDGNEVTLSSCVPGITLKVTTKGDEVVTAEGLAGSVQYTASGTIVTTSTSDGDKFITITPAGESSDSRQVYPLASDCVIKIDNSNVAFSALKNGQYVKIEVKGGKVTAVTAETKSYEYTGTLVSVKVDTSTVIKVKLSDGTTADYTLGTDAAIKRNSQTVDPWQLSEGDSVTLTVKAGAVTALNATSKNTNTEGTISAINISSKPSVTLTIGGAEKTYEVNSDTQFVVDDKEATIYELRLGASATVKLESSTIAKITTASVVVSPVLVGTVSYIHPTSYVMGIDVVDTTTGNVQTVQAVVKSTVKITDTTASNITKFKGITVGRSVVAVGTVNYGVYEINTITITN